MNENGLVKHLTMFAKVFVVPRRRARWLAVIEGGRVDRLVDELPHKLEADIDRSKAVVRPGSIGSVDSLLSVLSTVTRTKHGWCVSEIQELHGRCLPLRESLTHLSGGGAGTLVSIDAGRLAIFQPEDPDSGHFVLIADNRQWSLVSKMYGIWPSCSDID